MPPPAPSVVVVVVVVVVVIALLLVDVLVAGLPLLLGDLARGEGRVRVVLAEPVLRQRFAAARQLAPLIATLALRPRVRLGLGLLVAAVLAAECHRCHSGTVWVAATWGGRFT